MISSHTLETSEPRDCFKSLSFLKEQTNGETNGKDAEVGHAWSIHVIWFEDERVAEKQYSMAILI